MHLLPYWSLYSASELLEEQVSRCSCCLLSLVALFSSMPGLPSYPSQWLWVCIVFIHVASKILKLCTPSHLQVGILKCFLIHCVRTKQFSEKHKYWQWRSEVNMLSTTHCTKQIKIGFYLLFFLYVKFYLKAIFYISFLLILVLDEPTLVVNMKTIVKLSISQI